jgi:hypothetical protein
MTTDYRALCAELVDAIGSLVGGVKCGHYQQQDMWKCREIFDRARAALTQPEPEGPTDEEIAQFVAEWWENMHGFAPHGDKTVYTVFEFVAREHFADFTRDVLARWGTPANTINQEN